jgi:putative membrane protein
MEVPKLTQFTKTVFLLLPIFYAMGCIFHLIDRTYPLMLTLTPYTILGTAVIGFLPDILTCNRRLVMWAVGTFVCTLLLEILGVATGLVFGSYAYGSTLGFSLGEVPVLIGINWTLIIMGSLALVKRWITHSTIAALATAACTVIFDWIMEPVAMALDYWNWDAGHIPLQNYIAWFVIAFVFARVHEALELKSTTPIPSLIVGVQAVFFLFLRLFVI